jgi:hypothetical protein
MNVASKFRFLPSARKAGMRRAQMVKQAQEDDVDFILACTYYTELPQDTAVSARGCPRRQPFTAKRFTARRACRPAQTGFDALAMAVRHLHSVLLV